MSDYYSIRLHNAMATASEGWTWFKENYRKYAVAGVAFAVGIGFAVAIMVYTPYLFGVGVLIFVASGISFFAGLGFQFAISVTRSAIHELPITGAAYIPSDKDQRIVEPTYHKVQKTPLTRERAFVLAAAGDAVVKAIGGIYYERI